MVLSPASTLFVWLFFVFRVKVQSVHRKFDVSDIMSAQNKNKRLAPLIVVLAGDELSLPGSSPPSLDTGKAHTHTD